jgi:hypothetical protein
VYAGDAVPFPDALNSAAISVERLDRIKEDALLIGNGDVNALVYSAPAELRMMLTKNDVWDARLITAEDPPLPKLRWIKQMESELSGGGNTEIHEDGFRANRRDGYHDYPYPFPKPCAQLAFGNGVAVRCWGLLRAGGPQDAFLPEDNGAVMRLAGDPGCSNGYAISLKGLDLTAAARLSIELSGTPNARFFIDVLNEAGADNRFGLHTGWIDSPANDEVHAFELTEPGRHEQLILYTWSTDGKLAENHIRRITLSSESGKVVAELPLDEQSLTARVVHGTLDIRRAAARVTDPASGQRLLTARALAGCNVFRIESPLPCRIVPTATFDCEPPEAGTTGEVAWLIQKLPGDGDWQGMTYAVALAQDSETKAAAIVTSLEADDPLRAAIRLAADTLAADGPQAVDSHERQWEEFWSASGVELDDSFLQELWYRNLYFLRCVSKPGVECVGLYAGSVTEGCPAWHGNHTLNYNAQQTFWSAFVSNHVELSEPYVRLIDRYMTRARWLCQQIFEFDGAYIPHVVLAHEPVDPAQCGSRNGRQYVHHVWGFTMGVPAFAVQNLWHRYKYAPDREYLEQTAYPALRDVAIFQANFMDQCEPDAARPEQVVLAPSVSPEHWGWTKNFERNRDSTFDVAMFRFVFKAAIEGASRLERDEALVSRWEACLEKLPNYPVSGDDEPVVVDVRDAPPISYNIAIPAVPVFPGDQVTWFSPAEEQSLLARSIDRLKWNGNNSSVIVSVARARLSMAGSSDFMRSTFLDRLKPNSTLGINRAGSGINGHGHYTEQFAATMAVSELLLQSVGDVIRVFPAWPQERSARFTNLRTQGGFLVTAKQTDGHVAPVTVTSTVGGTLRLVSPWDAVEVERDGELTALTPNEQGVVELVTRPGERLVFHPR